MSRIRKGNFTCNSSLREDCLFTTTASWYTWSADSHVTLWAVFVVTIVTLALTPLIGGRFSQSEKAKRPEGGNSACPANLERRSRLIDGQGFNCLHPGGG